MFSKLSLCTIVSAMVSGGARVEAHGVGFARLCRALRFENLQVSKKETYMDMIDFRQELFVNQFYE